MSDDVTTGGTRSARSPGKRKPIPTLALTGAIRLWTVRFAVAAQLGGVSAIVGGGRLIDQFGQRALARL